MKVEWVSRLNQCIQQQITRQQPLRGQTDQLLLVLLVLLTLLSLRLDVITCRSLPVNGMLR